MIREAVNSYDVCIIGGGVVGLNISREISRYQLSVCVIEKETDVGRGCSKANSGIVHAGFDAKPGKKTLWLVPGATHAECYGCDPTGYREQLTRFLSDNGLLG